MRNRKRYQGIKDSRIKPVHPVPLETTGEQRKIDQVLGFVHKHFDPRPPESPKSIKPLSPARQEQLRREAANREAKEARRALAQQQYDEPHRHNYKQLYRITEDGNRVMSCKCGDYVLLEGTG